MKTSQLAERASLLIEALPYIRVWSGKTMVVKIGGEVLDDPENLEAFATDVALMRFTGMNPIVVHGGGRQISEAMTSFGRDPQFVGGQRVTDAETLEIVKMVLVGQINKQIVSAINRHGGRAVGISGEDGDLFGVRKITGPQGEDLGFVGEVSQVRPAILSSLTGGEFIPVVAPLGTGLDSAHNINADLAAGALATALAAEKVIFLTNVAGLFADLSDSDSLISETTVLYLKKLLSENVISLGMIPKIESLVSAIDSGVPRAHIIDGRAPHALLVELFTDGGSGTMVTP